MSFLDLSFSRPSVIVYRYVRALFAKASGNIFQETFLGWGEQKSFLIGWILIIQPVWNTLLVLQLMQRNLWLFLAFCFKLKSLLVSRPLLYQPWLRSRAQKTDLLHFTSAQKPEACICMFIHITQLKSAHSMAFTVYQINCFWNGYHSIYFHPSFVSCSCWQQQSWWARSSKWKVESWMQIQQ